MAVSERTTNLVVIHDFGISGYGLSRKLEVRYDNSCEAAKLDSAKGRKPERPRLHVDFGSPNQCKVSIPGQMRPVKLGLAKPEFTEVFNPNVRHIKVSKHLFEPSN